MNSEKNEIVKLIPDEDRGGDFMDSYFVYFKEPRVYKVAFKVPNYVAEKAGKTFHVRVTINDYQTEPFAIKHPFCGEDQKIKKAENFFLKPITILIRDRHNKLRGKESKIELYFDEVRPDGKNPDVTATATIAYNKAKVRERMEDELNDIESNVNE